MDTPITPPVISPREKEGKKGKRELGFERIRLALERLQLAWMRFSMTMIALGFTSYRFFYTRIEEGKTPLLKYFSGREVGMVLLFIGFVGLLQATFQHVRTYRKLKGYYPELTYSVSLLQSYLVLSLGLALLLFAIFEL